MLHRFALILRHRLHALAHLLTLALALHPTAAARAQQAAPADRPNIIFIFTDDHAQQAIGVYGSVVNTTPHLDRLAREGVVFRNSFCTNSICGPSRAVILTGKHSHLNGFINNDPPQPPFDGSQTTFPKLLQKAGYATALFGKWHLHSKPTGFDAWEVFFNQGEYYSPRFISAKGERVAKGYATDVVTDLSIQWLEKGRDKSKPFMLMSQHKAPHRFWMPAVRHLNLYKDVTLPEPATLFDDYANRVSAATKQRMSVRYHLRPLIDLKINRGTLNQKNAKGLYPIHSEFSRMTEAERAAVAAAYDPQNAEFFRRRDAGELQGDDLVRYYYQRYLKDYLRCIAAVDENVGRILDYLDESGLARNTIVVYASDQGFYLGEHGWYDKRWMYEESFRMPLIARWPGVTTPGSNVEALVQNLDYAPTFLQVAGVPAPAEMQGRSLVPLLKGQMPDDWRTSLYYRYYGEYTHNVPAHYGVRTDRHKLIYYNKLNEWELFDLDNDPHELRSVYSDPAYARTVGTLKAELARLRQQYKDAD